jgi:2-oxoglutarate dehydrogenase E2 component (dihydrolipoamide succinyltransferase)
MSISIVVPEVGESVVDARVARWLKKEGEAVAAGEPVVELETDKVDVEVPAPAAGVLGPIAHQEGEDVKVGDALGVIHEGSAPAPAKPAAVESGESTMPDRPATPSARTAAREAEVPLTAVAAEGPRVTKADVARATPAARPVERARPASPEPRRVTPEPPPDRRELPADARPEIRERMSRRRATIARRLVEAQQTAALPTTFNDIDMSAVQAVRQRQKEAFKTTHGVGLGIVSFFVRAAIAALKEFPRLNAEIQGDEMVLKRYYDIGIAVGAAEGLVVPVLRDADTMPFAAIETAIRDFSARATDGTLTLEDLRGGTFSITNGGVFGSLMSTPIVNPPQVAILGLHAIVDRPVGVNGQIALRPMMYVALTYDHRLVDGADAVRFLARIKALVEDPGLLLIEI